MSQDLRRGVPRAALALALLSACGSRCGHCGALALEDAGADETEEAGAKLGVDELAPERCRFEGDPLALGPGQLELGRADTRVADHLDIGAASGGIGEVIRIGIAGTTLSVSSRTSLGPLAADAPPPRAFSLASATYALFHPGPKVADGGGGKRHLRLVKLGGPSVETVVDLPDESLDESLAFDGAVRDDAAPSALFAWDDDEGDRGVIRVASYQNGTMSTPITVSASKGDASSPRVLTTSDGYIVVWSVRKDDTQPDGAPKISNDTDIEGPGQLRGFEWIESVRLGLDGKPRGAPMKLTPDSGHVGSFELAAGPSPSDADVYARDAAQRGKLVHVAIRGETSATTTLELPSAAIGAPEVQRWADGTLALAYEDGSGHSLLAWLDPKTGEPLGRASDESVLDVGSVLVGAERGRLVVFEAGQPSQAREPGTGRLRLAACQKDQKDGPK